MQQTVSFATSHGLRDADVIWAFKPELHRRDDLDAIDNFEREAASKMTGGSKNQVAPLADWQTKKVSKYIDDNIETTLRVQDLGRLVNLSVSRFSKGFKVSFGKSPHIYILDRRVEAAKYLIDATDQSLCQIAQACGLSDQSHLSKIFKQHMGATPMGWRRARKAIRNRSVADSPYSAVL